MKSNKYGRKFCAICLAAAMSMSSAALPVMAATNDNSVNPGCADLLDQNTKDQINGVIDWINNWSKANQNSNNSSSQNSDNKDSDNNTSTNSNNQNSDNADNSSSDNQNSQITNDNIKVTKTHTVKDLIENIDQYVSGVENKGAVYGANNIDLSSDVKILDPASIAAVVVDTTGVEWDQYGIWPVKYTICYKPDKNDTTDLSKLDQTDYGRNQSAYSIYTDIASKLKDNEYATLDIIKYVDISTAEILNLDKKDGSLKYNHVFTDDSQLYKFNQKKNNMSAASKFDHSIHVIGRNGLFKTKNVKVTKTFEYVTGNAGYYCGKCGKKFCGHGKNRYGSADDTTEAINDHVNSYCNSNYITFDETSSKFLNSGDNVNLTIWQTK